MTVSIVYARGGGHGHAMRGAIVQERLRREGHETILLVEPGSDRWLGAAPRSYASIHDVQGDELVVDTFPRGWQDEIDETVLARFSHRTLVARYNRDAAWSSAAYDRVLSPYPAHLDEWDAPIAEAEHVGWLVREAPLTLDAGGNDFVVLDAQRRVPAPLLERLSAFVRRLGMSLVHLDVAPRSLHAKKLLTIGAGYHTVYEHAQTEADLRFFPLARRFDDQHRRAARIGRGVSGLQDVLDWLVAPMDPTAFGAQA